MHQGPPSSTNASPNVFLGMRIWRWSNVSGQTFSATRAQEPCTLRVFGCQQISADTRTNFKYQALQIPANTFVQIFAQIDQRGTSWFPGRASKLLRVRYFGIFLNLIGFQHPSIGAFYWGDRHGKAGWEPWRTLVFDQGWRWCFSIQPWSRPQSMATPSTIFNGDLGPPPNWILSRVAWRQLKWVRLQHRKGHSTLNGMPQPILTLGQSTSHGMP